eukprot:scaffold110571_cov47-Attheya_sp.AAC.3
MGETWIEMKEIPRNKLSRLRGGWQIIVIRFQMSRTGCRTHCGVDGLRCDGGGIRVAIFAISRIAY